MKTSLYTYGTTPRWCLVTVPRIPCVRSISSKWSKEAVGNQHAISKQQQRGDKDKEKKVGRPLSTFIITGGTNAIHLLAAVLGIASLSPRLL